MSSPTLGASAPELQDFQAKCEVIPFGVEHADAADDRRPCARADEIRREADQPIVLFVGRLVPYKGVDVLLEALQGLDARRR